MKRLSIKHFLWTDEQYDHLLVRLETGRFVVVESILKTRKNT
jgi:hypothetical protein